MREPAREPRPAARAPVRRSRYDDGYSTQARLRLCTPRLRRLTRRIGPSVGRPTQATTLSLIGIPWKIIPFPQFELQSKWVARVLSGRVRLPSRAEMEADIVKVRGAPVDTGGDGSQGVFG